MVSDSLLARVAARYARAPWPDAHAWPDPHAVRDAGWATTGEVPQCGCDACDDGVAW